MVIQLEQAIQKAKLLSDWQQEMIAAIIEAEIADDNRWQAKFDASPGTLQKLVDSAKAQYDSGSCGDL